MRLKKYKKEGKYLSFLWFSTSAIVRKLSHNSNVDMKFWKALGVKPAGASDAPWPPAASLPKASHPAGRDRAIVLLRS
jgi:hypothetical protein